MTTVFAQFKEPLNYINPAYSFEGRDLFLSMVLGT